MKESWHRQGGGPGAASNRILSLDDQHRTPRLRDGYSGRQTIGPRADHERVVTIGLWHWALTLEQSPPWRAGRADGSLQEFPVEQEPLDTPLATSKHTDDACAEENEDRNLATVRHERIAPVGRIRIQMRPGPYRAEGGVYSKVSDNHRYNHGSRSQSSQNAEPDEACGDKLYPAGQYLTVRPSRSDSPQRESPTAGRLSVHRAAQAGLQRPA